MAHYAEPNEELSQALYYLNNRHRLALHEMPKYLKALALAEVYGLEYIDGVWRLPQSI